MKINIHADEDIDTSTIRQTLLVYQTRVETSINTLTLELNRLRTDSDRPAFKIRLCGKLIGGKEVAFSDTQADPQLAMQRLMDRLERHIQRRQVVQNLGYARQASR